MRVLVTGASGMLGRDVAGRLAHAGHETIAADREQVDVEDRVACRRAVRRLRPEIVIDCSVPRGDPDRPALAAGAAHLARAARSIDAYTIYLSCAEVFDGRAEAPYVESDTPVPVTAFGVAKLDAETAVRRSNPRHLIVRTSWLFGTASDNFFESILTTATTTDVISVDALTRSSPTYTVNLAAALVALAERRVFGVLHLSGSGSCTRVQAARAVLRAAGVRATVVATANPGVGSQAASNLVLASRRREAPQLPDWRVALRAYLDARIQANTDARRH
jgi:dTDP-4-dehydrorhamnose reductase